MLSLVYIAILAVPLALLALALLRTIARGADGPATEPSGRRTATPLASPPSTSRLRDTRLDLRHSLGRALAPDPDAAARVVASPRERATPLLAAEPRPLTAAWAEATPASVRVPVGVPTKDCPDCSESVLAAARVCKHCRYRFDAEPAGVYDWQDAATG